MIKRLQGYRLLAGYRGSEPADISGLAQAAAAVGRLMHDHPELAEVDLNPVMVSAEGAVAVDWKLTAGD